MIKNSTIFVPDSAISLGLFKGFENVSKHRMRDFGDLDKNTH